MFTLQQIKDAHSKVETGADFPKYIKELKELWVIAYDTYVIDGHATYIGESDYQVSSEAKYDTLNISTTSDSEKFVELLKLHQQWWSDYMQFCEHCAQTWVNKRIVDLRDMTCTYYDLEGNEMLVESIPEL